MTRCSAVLAGEQRIETPASAITKGTSRVPLLLADEPTGALDSKTSTFVGDRAYFRAALATRAFVVSQYQEGRLSRVPVITFAPQIEQLWRWLQSLPQLPADYQFAGRKDGVDKDGEDKDGAAPTA